MPVPAMKTAASPFPSAIAVIPPITGIEMTLRRTCPAVTVAALLLIAATLSHAAGLPSQKPSPATPAAASAGRDWVGPYAGLFAGYGWGHARSTSPYDSNTGFYYNWTGNAYSSDTAGFFGGGTLGANWQSRQLVFGPEGEIGYLRLKGSVTDPNFQPGTVPIADTVTRSKSNLYAAAYGRVGMAAGNALLYGKGGVAILRAEASTIDPCANVPGCGTTTLSMTGRKTMAGWSAGGGIEWKFRPHWCAKAEYAHYDFGNLDTAGPSSVAGEYYRQSIDVTAHTVKVGLNYRF